MPMKLIHLTDTHFVRPGERLYGLDPRARLDACIADINRNHGDARLAVITGDLTHYGDRAAFIGLRDALAALTVPVRLLLGNHDTVETFREVFPDAPVDAEGRVQGVEDTEAGRLIFLDTNMAGTHAGWYDQPRLDWLSARLAEAPEGPVYLFMHHPPFALGIASMDRIGLIRPDDFEACIAPHRARIRHIFFGHVHRPVSGSWRGIPFSTLRATNHQVWMDLDAPEIRVSHEPPAYAVVLLSPDQTIVHTHDFLDAGPVTDLTDIAGSFWDEQARRAEMAEA